MTSNKTKYLEVQEKLNSQTTKYYNFLSSRLYLTNDNGSKDTFVYQPTLDTLELKKDKGNDYILSWKSEGVCNSKLKPLYSTFLDSIKLSG